jgi:hypothetical protein
MAEGTGPQTSRDSASRNLGEQGRRRAGAASLPGPQRYVTSSVKGRERIANPWPQKDGGEARSETDELIYWEEDATTSTHPGSPHAQPSTPTPLPSKRRTDFG